MDVNNDLRNFESFKICNLLFMSQEYAANTYNFYLFGLITLLQSLRDCIQIA